MSSQAVGTYKLNAFWESGRLIYYEKASGHTTTGNVFILGHDYVQVGDTANDVDLQWYGTTTGTFVLDAAAHTLAMTGMAASTDGAVTITNATATSSTTTGALIVTGGIATAADIFCGDDLFFASTGVINFAAGNVTITHATGGLTCNGALTLSIATESTSTTTGALIVAGGIGFAGDMYVGDDIFLTSAAKLDFGAGNITITHSAGKLAFAGATSVANGYTFDMAVGTITTEAHGVDITATGTLASNKGLVGLNVKATAAGTAGAWLSGLFVNATQASKMVNGYLCAAEFELTSTASGASDNSVIVLNSVRNHTGSAPACDPYITLREYGTTYGNVFLRVFGDTGQGGTGTFSASALITSAQNAYEAECNAAIRCMSGSTPVWILCSTTAPTA